MLKDRRELLEYELHKATNLAAEMYLSIITKDVNAHSDEYQTMRARITRLQFDLDMVNRILEKGE